MIKKNKSYIFLLLTYILSQLNIVFITGQWWDDWTIWTSSASEIKSIFSENGLPWEAYNLFSVMWIPHWGYRIIVFFLFLFAGLFYYLILKQLDFITEEDAFWISAVAVTVPVNDARATLICYGYSLSLCLFMLAFYTTTHLNSFSGWKKLVLRIISLCCLFYSYTTQSLLVFTGLIWLYLNYVIWKDNNCKKTIQKVVLFFRIYFDYFLIPFIFFIIKNTFFNPYGRYHNYNSITMKSFINGTFLSPLASLKTLALITQSYLSQIGFLSVIVFSIVIILYFFTVGKPLEQNQQKKSFPTIKKQLLIFILGALVYYAGIFAYIIVRGGAAIENTGVSGRDAMLAGYGISIMIVVFSRLLPIKKTVQNTIPLFFIIMGVFHFNDGYLNYQEDWYHQQEFANAIEYNKNFSEANTILCDFSTSSPTNGTRFYSLNGMYYAVTGKKDKFFFSRINDLQYGLEFNNTFLTGYNADDYDYSDMTIDGILFINNAPISNSRLLQIKFHEMFAPNVYEKDIHSITNQTYVSITKETSEKIYELYSNNTLTSDVLLEIVTSSN